MIAMKKDAFHCLKHCFISFVQIQERKERPNKSIGNASKYLVLQGHLELSNKLTDTISDTPFTK